MADIFGVRSLLYWWGILTTTVFLRDYLKQLAEFFKPPPTVPAARIPFSPDKIPFNIVPGLNSWIDQAADYIYATVKFDPKSPLLTIGSIVIPSYVLGLVFALILIILAALLVRRALKSPVWFDDFVAIFAMYVILRIIGHIISRVEILPFAGPFRALIDLPIVAYVIIMLLLLLLTFFGEGFQSKRAFWRAIIAGTLLSLFMFPREMSIILGYIIEALYQFGAGLANPANIPFAVAWGLIGMVLALQRLMTSDKSGGGGKLSEAHRVNTEIETGKS